MTSRPRKDGKSFLDWLLRDTHGRLAIVQLPNVPLASWLVTTGLSKLFHTGQAQHGFVVLAQASLFTWAYLEIIKGSSVIRRLIGAVIMLLLLKRFFS